MSDYLLEETEIEWTGPFPDVMVINSFTNWEATLVTVIHRHEPHLKTFLGAYYYEGKGAVEQIQLKKGSLVQVDENSGIFSVNYTVYYHAGCSDVSYTDRQEMKITFEIDFGRKAMKLAGERIPLRAPDEF